MELFSQNIRINDVKKAFNNIYKISLILIILGMFVFNCIWVIVDKGFYDYSSFMASGFAARHGLNPYGSNYPTIFHIEIPEFDIDVKAVNLNPPIFLPLFEFLSRYPTYLSFRTWQIFSVLLYLVIIYLIIKNFMTQSAIWRVIWILSLAGFWQTIKLGQIYIPLLFLYFCILILYKKQQKIAAAIILGLLIAIKPNFIIWAGLLFVCKDYIMSILSVATCGILSLIPVMIYGIPIYQAWNFAVQQFNGYTLPANNTFIGLFSRFGLYHVGSILGGLLLIVMTIIIWKKKPNWQLTSSFAIVLSLLSSPIAWCGYTLFLIPILYERKWSTTWKVAAIIFTVPFYLIQETFLMNKFNFVFWGWFYGWGIVIVLIKLIRELFKTTNNISESTLVNS